MKIQLSDHFTFSKLLRFTFPAMVMMVFTSLYGVVDGLFVSNYVGKTALAAINFVFPVLNILATFGYMFGAGGSALVAKTMGEKKDKKANSLFSLFVYISFVIGVVFSVLGVFLLKPLLSTLGAEGKMLSDALIYGYILLVSMPLWNLQFLFQIFFVTAEKPKLGLYVTLVAGCANMLLDALFMAAFSWGIQGAAIATAISQILGGGIPLLYFFRKNTSRLRLGRTNIDVKSTLKAASNGMSELVNGTSSSMVGILYNIQLLKYAGEDGVAAYSIMMYICFVFVGIFFGFANGSAPVVGYHYGAQNYSEMKNLRRKIIIFNVSSSILMCLISEALSSPLSSVFAGYDKALYTLTLNGLRVYSLSFLFSGMAIFGSSFFTALNNGPVSAVIAFMRTIVFQVGCVLVFPVLWGIDGIWISVIIAEMLAAAVSVIFTVGLRKKYNY